MSFSNRVSVLQGEVELEFELLKQEEAAANPVGKGRDEPHPLAKPKYVWTTDSLII